MSIDLEIDPDSDLEFIRFNVANRIRTLYPKLPIDVTYPIIQMSGGEDKFKRNPILTYSLYADDDGEKISVYARDQLIPKLSTLEGIEKIELSGNKEPEWVISYDEHKMNLLGITLQELRASIAQFQGEEGLNEVLYNDTQIAINLSYGGQEKLRNLIVKSTSENNIYLHDISDIYLTKKETRFLYRINGKSNVRINLYPTKSANQLVSAQAVKSYLSNIETGLPDGYKILLEYDATEFLKKELDKIELRSMLSLGLLLLFVLLTYRNLRYIVIIVSSLVINLGIAIVIYYLLGVQINLYALAAITISFGILIDNALIMIHHIEKYKDIEVFPSLVSATLTTIASLIIIFFLPELWKNNLKEFGRVIVVNLSISLLVAGIFVPAFLHRWTSKQKKEIDHRYKNINRWNKLFSFIHRYRKWVKIACVFAFGIPVFLLPGKWEGVEWYNKSIGSDKYQEDIRPIVDRIFGGTFRLFYRYVYESGSFRNNEETKLHANARLPDGSTFQQADELSRMVEEYLKQYHPTKVKNFTLNIFNGESISFNISFSDDNDFSFPYILKNRLISMATNLGGAEWSVYGVGKGFSNASGSSPPSFRLKMKGFNQEGLNLYGNKMAELLEAHPRIKEVDRNAAVDFWSRDKYLYEMEFDQNKMSNSNITLPDIYSTMLTYSPIRNYAATTRENVPIQLINKSYENKSIWNIYNESITKDSSLINLQDLASINKTKSPKALHKENQQYVRMLSWSYTGSARFGSKYLKEKLQEFEPTLPLGYSVSRSAYNYFTGQAKRQYTLLALIIVLIFMINCVHFESLKTALSIIFLIPISFIGIFLTFYYFDFPFDQGGYTSFILLSGITVNSLILILSDYYRLRKQEPDIPVMQHYTQAFLGKIKPILLSIFSTIFGLIPFLLFGDQEIFWFALAAGTIGGLLFSVFAICFIMPAFIGNR